MDDSCDSCGRLKLLEWMSLAIGAAGLLALTALLPTPWWPEPLFGGAFGIHK